MPISFAEALRKPQPQTTIESDTLGKTLPGKHISQNGVQQKDSKKKKRSPQQSISSRYEHQGPPSSQQPQVMLLPKPSTLINLEQDFPSLSASSISRVEMHYTSKTENAEAVAKLESQPVMVESPVTIREVDERADETAQAESVAPTESTTLPSLLTAFGAKQRSVEEVNLMGTFLKNPSVIKKGLQRLAPRKKRFTALKKKVLQERLEQWNATNASPSEIGDASTTESARLATTVALLHFCVPEETQDEDELEEIVSNLRDMSSKVGEVQDVTVDRLRGHAFCRFATPDLANAAHACWNGLVIGGERIAAKLVSSVPTDETWMSSVQVNALEDGEAEDGLTTVILENVLTQDDLEDYECLQESLEDIRKMASDVGTLVEMKIENQNQVVLAYRGKQTALRCFDGKVIGGQIVAARLREDIVTSVVLLSVLTDDDLEDVDCLEESLRGLRNLASCHGVVKDLKVNRDPRDVVILYEGDVAQAAACNLNGCVIGGRAIHAEELQRKSTQSHQIMLFNLLTESDYEDEECLSETKADIADIAGRFGRVIRIEVDLRRQAIMLEFREDISVVEAAVEKFNGMVIGGQSVSAFHTAKGESIPIGGVELHEFPDEENVAKIALQPMFSGDKLIPERFAEMKRAPKIQRRSDPRPYATLVNDESAKPLLIEMLSELMRLQKRAVLEQNTKAKRRLVMGLREVARGIRSRKVKIVVMANNLDQYGAIDEKLQEIINMAKDERVPIFYELNKRNLGKAIGKTIKVGVIGVQAADGAEQQLKKLLSLATSHGLI